MIAPETTPRPGTPRSTIGVLGAVTVDGHPVPGVRARRLLVSLVLARPRVRSTARLIEHIWGEDQPKAPQAALHTQISRLRQHLGAAEIIGVPGGYRLDNADTDLDAVRSLLASLPSGWMDDADALWRGSPGEDLGERDELVDELRDEADRLGVARERAAIRTLLTDGDFPRAQVLAEIRSAADPLDEQAHLELMQALAGQGRYTEALAVFSGIRRRLSAELGMDPGSQLTELNAALTREAPAVPPSPVAAAAESRPSAGARFRDLPATGLRAETNPLLGRVDDLEAVDGLLSGHRVVTVIGPGGLGKTRLANAVGLRAAERGQSVCAVPLASVRDDDDVAAAVASALGAGEGDVNGSGRMRTSMSELSALLAEAISERDLLLILDNCEQVIDGCARLVNDLVGLDGTLTVLVTSRSPLIIPAEQVYQLPTLAADGAAPAVELFMQRARAVRPDARLDRAAVAELCRQLDGLPLAIELAAARVRTMTVDEISDRIAQRLTLLRTADRTAPDRHRTLHAVIDWSWNLLSERAQRALSRLCRFPGGISRAAAARVSGCDPAELDDVLDELVNQSLIGVTEDGTRSRYRMLEMVREFGESKLIERERAGVDAESVDDAMAAWACELAVTVREATDAESGRSMFDMASAETENLVWVLRRALDAGVSRAGEPDSAARCSAASCSAAQRDEIVVHVYVYPVLSAVWSMRGLHAEAASWSQRVLDSLGDTPEYPDPRARDRWQLTILIAGGAIFFARDQRRAMRARRRLRVLHRPVATFDYETEFLSALALSATAGERMRIIRNAVATGATQVRRIALAIRSNARENSGNLAGSVRDAQTLSAEDVREPWASAMIRMHAANLYSQQAQWDKAQPLYASAVEDLASIGATDDGAQARMFILLGRLARRDIEGSERELREVGGWAPPDRPPGGDREMVAVQALGWAEIARMRGEPSTALYLDAIDVLLNDFDPHRADPGEWQLVSAATCGMILSGGSVRSNELLQLQIVGVRLALARRSWRDMPQIGSTLLAIGLLVADLAGDSGSARRHDGALLILAGIAVGARRDYPAAAEAIAHIRELSGLSDIEWAAAVDATEGRSRRQLLGDAQAVLGGIDGRGPLNIGESAEFADVGDGLSCRRIVSPRPHRNPRQD